MSKRKDSISRMLRSASISMSGKEKDEKPLATSVPMQLPRRRTPVVQVASNEDSTGSEQHSPMSLPSTPTSASARLLRMTSKVGLGSLDTSSNSSLRSITMTSQEPAGPSVRPKNSFRSNAPKPLKLDERTTAFYLEQPLSDREAATPSYEDQFRRRRGDMLHRLGPSVPYMQAYGPTSLQW